MEMDLFTLMVSADENTNKALDKWDCWRSNLKSDKLFSIDCDNGKSMLENIEDGVNAIKQQLIKGKTIRLGFSGGKDSSVCLEYLILALMDCVRKKIPISQHNVVTHSDTLVENPAVRNLANSRLDTLSQFIRHHQLPLSILISKPTFSSSFIGRVITGRALVTTAKAAHRQCTDELKISPQESACNAFFKARKVQKSDVVLVLGSRSKESEIRAKNIEGFGGGEFEPHQLDENSEWVLYPIKSLSTMDVWDFLTVSGKKIPSFEPSKQQLVELYKDSTGECVYAPAKAVKQDGLKNDPCSARHGCWTCCVGDRHDRSMEKMLEAPQHQHMRLLNRIRNFMIHHQNNMEKRAFCGRTINDHGFSKITPACYSFEHVKQLFHALISADFLELERAEARTRKFKSEGKHLDDLCNVQFQHVTIEDVLGVEYAWACHTFTDETYAALEIYNKVWQRGELELLDHEWGEIIDQKPPKPLFVNVGCLSWDDAGFYNSSVGFRDFDSETISRDYEFDFMGSEKDIAVMRDIRKDDVLSINVDDFEFLEEEIKYKLIKHKDYLPMHAAQWLLREGIVRLYKSGALKHREMQNRTAFYRSIGLTGKINYEDLKSNPSVMTECEMEVWINSIQNNSIGNALAVARQSLTEKFDDSTLNILSKIKQDVISNFEINQSELMQAMEIQINSINTIKQNQLPYFNWLWELFHEAERTQ